MFDEKGMKVVVNKNDTLAILRKNREAHAAIVKEAREGYIEEAKKALEKRLEDLRSGKLASLMFQLHPPGDYTKQYDVAIKMLEMHTNETLEMTTAQVMHLVMDQWEWKHNFLVGNSRYSATAKESLESEDD